MSCALTLGIGLRVKPGPRGLPGRTSRTTRRLAAASGRAWLRLASAVAVGGRCNPERRALSLVKLSYFIPF
jgi:hypothetical protein